MSDLRHALNCQNVLSMREINLFYVAVFDTVTKAIATTLCKSLEKFQISTTSNKPKRPIDSDKCAFGFIIIIMCYYYESKRNEMYWIEYDYRPSNFEWNCSIKSTIQWKEWQTIITKLVDELFWYLVCIEFRSCYKFNCSLFDSEMSQFNFTHWFLRWLFYFIFVLWFWVLWCVVCCNNHEILLSCHRIIYDILHFMSVVQNSM